MARQKLIKENQNKVAEIKEEVQAVLDLWSENGTALKYKIYM